MIRVIKCREIAELMDTDKVDDLGIIDRIQYRMHLWFCWHCRRLARQIQWLGEIARQHVRIVKPAPDFESRLLKKISEL